MSATGFSYNGYKCQFPDLKNINAWTYIYNLFILYFGLSKSSGRIQKYRWGKTLDEKKKLDKISNCWIKIDFPNATVEPNLRESPDVAAVKRESGIKCRDSWCRPFIWRRWPQLHDEWLPVCLLERGGFDFLSHFYIKPVFYAIVGYFQIVSVAPSYNLWLHRFSSGCFQMSVTTDPRGRENGMENIRTKGKKSKM